MAAGQDVAESSAGRDRGAQERLQSLGVPNTEDDASPVLDQPPPHTLVRTLLIAIGCAALLFGGVAVFKSANGAGTVALLAIGAFFLLVGASGQRLLRAKLGESEIVLAPIIRRVLKEGAEEVKQALAAEILESSALSEYSGLRAQAEGVLYERDLALALEHAVWSGLGDVSVQSEVSVGNHRADFVVARGEKRVLVEVKLRSGYINTTDVDRMLHQARAHGTDRDRYLLVSNAPLTQSAADRLQLIPRARFVHWASHDDDKALVSAVGELLSVD